MALIFLDYYSFNDKVSNLVESTRLCVWVGEQGNTPYVTKPVFSISVLNSSLKASAHSFKLLWTRI